MCIYIYIYIYIYPSRPSILRGEIPPVRKGSPPRFSRPGTLSCANSHGAELAVLVWSIHKLRIRKLRISEAKSPTDLGTPPLKMKSLPASDPLKSRISVRGLAAASTPPGPKRRARCRECRPSPCRGPAGDALRRRGEACGLSYEGQESFQGWLRFISTLKRRSAIISAPSKRCARTLGELPAGSRGGRPTLGRLPPSTRPSFPRRSSGPERRQAGCLGSAATSYYNSYHYDSYYNSYYYSYYYNSYYNSYYNIYYYYSYYARANARCARFVSGRFCSPSSDRGDARIVQIVFTLERCCHVPPFQPIL